MRIDNEGIKVSMTNGEYRLICSQLLRNAKEAHFRFASATFKGVEERLEGLYKNSFDLAVRAYELFSGDRYELEEEENRLMDIFNRRSF